MHIASAFKFLEDREGKKYTCVHVSRVLLKLKKIFQKPHTKVADVKKTGVELTMMEFDRHQEVDFIGENMLLLLYSRFVMSIGIGF
mmetsp:Transcript_39263/g.44861  ORF Transcript_39263/g.44861 Transcript_39263/m.44861 type:complete len:86 (-) Transcript_39263:590-847(-)